MSEATKKCFYDFQAERDFDNERGKRSGTRVGRCLSREYGPGWGGAWAGNMATEQLLFLLIFTAKCRGETQLGKHVQYAFEEGWYAWFVSYIFMPFLFQLCSALCGSRLVWLNRFFGPLGGVAFGRFRQFV